MVSAGEYSTFAISTDNRLFAVGRNQFGELGDGTTISRSLPVQIGTSSWSMVSGGAGFAAAIRTDGGLFTWGSNNRGQLGSGTTTNRSSPVQIGSSSWSMVTTGNYHAGAITTNGSLFTWGFNNRGQLGLGNTTNFSSPVQVGTSSWSMVSAGGPAGTTGPAHMLGIRFGGNLFAWGYNTQGQLGDDTKTQRTSPVQIGTKTWTDISAGGQHSTGLSKQ
jgi:alpha-tubulin suppressor-like RCC1 family protein